MKLIFQFGLVSLIFLAVAGFGQSLDIDSLENNLENIKDDSAYFGNLLSIGIQYRKSDVSKANDIGEKALEFATRKSMFTARAEALNFLGVNKAIQGEYDVAQNHLVDALKLFELNGDKKGQAKTYNNLSGVLLTSGHIEKAGFYLDRAINLWTSIGDSARIADGYVARAIIFRTQKDFSKALGYLQTALQIYTQNHEAERMGQVYFNLGNVQRDLNRLADALYSFKKAIALDQNEATYHLPELYRLQGEIFTSFGRYDSAEYYFTNALKIAEMQDLKKDKMEVFESFSKLYKSQGDYQKALEYLERHDQIEHDLYDNEKSRQMQEMQTRFQTKEKDQQLKLNAYLINKQQIIITASAIGVFLLLIILGLSLVFYREKSKSNKQLIRLNREIREKSQQISTQAEELQAMNAEIQAINTNLERIVEDRTMRIHHQNQILRDYAYMNAHRVRGPLARILGLINLFKFHQVEVIELFDKVERSAVELDHVIKEINSALENNDVKKE